MAQTLKTRRIYTGWKTVLIEKPHASRRIFFSIKVLTDFLGGHRSHISFGDPVFSSYYTLDESVQQLEAKGEGIFQGDIWVENISPSDLIFVTMETLV